MTQKVAANILRAVDLLVKHGFPRDTALALIMTQRRALDRADEQRRAYRADHARRVAIEQRAAGDEQRLAEYRASRSRAITEAWDREALEDD